MVIMQRVTAKSLDGVNIKSTTCRVTLWCWCEGFGTVLPVLMEMKLEVEMLCCTSQAEPLHGLRGVLLTCSSNQLWTTALKKRVILLKIKKEGRWWCLKVCVKNSSQCCGNTLGSLVPALGWWLKCCCNKGTEKPGPCVIQLGMLLE